MHRDDKYAAALMVCCMFVLAGEYGYIDISAISGSALGISFNNKLIKDSNLVHIIGFSSVVGLLIAHIKVRFFSAIPSFQNGYRYHPEVIAELSDYIIKKTERKMYGAPVANINPGLINREHACGKYQRAPDDRSIDIKFRVSNKTHRLALCYTLGSAGLARRWVYKISLF